MAQKKIYRMRDLGKIGIINDIPPYDLAPNTWSDGNNVRFEAGRVQKIGGWAPTVAEPTGFTTGITKGMPDEVPYALTPKPLTQVGSSAIVYGTAHKLYQVAGLSHTDLSKPNTTYDMAPEFRWEYTNLSNVLVFTTRKSNPQGLVPGTNNFDDLPGWGHDEKGHRSSSTNPADADYGKWLFTGPGLDWKTPVIRAYKNYLVALSTYEDGREHPQRVRWSDVALPSQLPENWSAEDVDSVAGFNDLSNATGTIQDGLALRDSLMIYTDEDTYAMDLVGGDFKFNFRKVFPESGILARGCVTEFEGKHFVITKTDIIVHDGSTITPVASSRVKDYLMREITASNYSATRCYTNTAHKEIWITYVGKGRTGNKLWSCNRAAIWNWQYDTWTYADLPGVFDITSAQPPDTDKRQWDGYAGNGINSKNVDGSAGTKSVVQDGVQLYDTDKKQRDTILPTDDQWNSARRALESWSNDAKTFTGRQLIAATEQKCFMILDTGRVQTTVTYNRSNPLPALQYVTTTTPVSCRVTRTGLDLDEQEADISYNKIFRSLYPQMGGQGTVLFTIGGSTAPTEPPQWDSTQYFDIGKDYKVDCWSNHKYLAISIEDSNEGAWNFTGFDVDYVTEGNR